MDPMMVSLTARIIYEERLQEFEAQRYAESLGVSSRLEMAITSLASRIRTTARRQFGPPAVEPRTATQEVACVNC